MPHLFQLALLDVLFVHIPKREPLLLCHYADSTKWHKHDQELCCITPCFTTACTFAPVEMCRCSQNASTCASV